MAGWSLDGLECMMERNGCKKGKKQPTTVSTTVATTTAAAIISDDACEKNNKVVNKVEKKNDSTEPDLSAVSAVPLNIKKKM